MSHEWQNNVGLCIYCHTWCGRCNQCKCEVNTPSTRRVCPDKDMKKEARNEAAAAAGR